MNVSIKQLASRIAIAGILGSIAGAIMGIAYRFVVAFLHILVRGQSISRLGAVVSSFWVSSEVVKSWIAVGALVGVGIVLLWFLRIGNVRRSPLIISLLALWIIGLVLFGWLQYQKRLDQAAIRQRYLQFCVAVSEHRYEEAYSYMTPDYRSKHTVDQFRTDERIGDNLYSAMEVFGCDLHSQHHVEVSGDKATLYPLTFEFSELYSGLAVELEKSGEWYFTGESSWYSN
jgi:hypothetical protein